MLKSLKEDDPYDVSKRAEGTRIEFKCTDSQDLPSPLIRVRRQELVDDVVL